MVLDISFLHIIRVKHSSSEVFLVDYLVCFFGDCSENGKSEGSSAIQDTQNDNNLVEQSSEAPDRYLMKIIVLISLNMIVVYMIMIMNTALVLLLFSR